MLAIAAATALTLRVGMIPDVNPSAIIRNADPLVHYLEARTGATVELTVPTNYAAVVQALQAGRLDFAYLGGFTYVQAHQRAGVLPLVQREGDRRFHSLFITQAGSPIHSLADLKGKTFAYGDVNSTSGHLMPAYFLDQHHLADAFKQTVFTGGHDATAMAVANGKVDAGAIDETVYRNLLSKGVISARQVRVFWTTPAFTDYVWAVSPKLAPQLRQRLAGAYLALDARKPHDKQILDLLRGSRFVPASDAEYAKLRLAALHEHLLR